MYSHGTYTPNKHRLRRAVLLLVVFIVLIVAGIFAVQRWYYINLGPVSSVQKKQYFIVSTGSSASGIAAQLFKAGLIRSDKVFTWYISLHDDRDKLQAGTYSFSPSQSTADIADEIVSGKVTTDLITILPGQRLDQIRQAFIKSGFEAAAVDAALTADQYRANY